MAYPTSLDSFTTHNTGDTLQPADVNDLNAASSALETKVGVNSSAVATTIDYLLKNPASIDPGHKHTSSVVSGSTGSGSFVLSNSPTITTPTVTGVDGTTSYITSTLNSNSSQDGACLQFTDGNNYNFSIGTTNDTTGNFAFFANRFKGNAGTKVMQVNQNGTVIVGNTTVSNLANGSLLAVAGLSTTDVVNASLTQASHGTGTVTYYIGNAAITAVSDVRLKTNIKDSEVDAVDLLGKLRVVDHNWSEKFSGHEYYNSKGTYTGLIAQEAIEHIPQVFNANGGEHCAKCLAGEECPEHGDWHVQYDYLVPTLIKAIQELKAEIEVLKSK